MAFITAWVLLALPAAAQSALDERLGVGDRVFVTRPGEPEIDGRVQTVDNNSLVIDGRTIQLDPDTLVEREGDSLFNGAFWGFSIGVVAGAATLPGYLAYDLVGADSCREGPRARCMLGTGLVYAAIGAAIDAMHKGRTVVRGTRGARQMSVAVGPRSIRLMLAF